VAAKFDLFSQQRLAGAAIFGALVGKTKAAGARERCGGFQGGTISGFQGDLGSVDLNGPRLQDVRAEAEPTR
jgi:hypothetical protein